MIRGGGGDGAEVCYVEREAKDKSISPSSTNTHPSLRKEKKRKRKRSSSSSTIFRPAIQKRNESKKAIRRKAKY